MKFHDTLLVFAYERQIACDLGNSPYYLDCLQGIATGRNSEELLTKAALEESSGKVSLKDIQGAYKTFGLDMQSPYDDEDHIIGTFQSRIADSSLQEPELRRALNVIGHHRGSTRIQDFASNSKWNFLIVFVQQILTLIVAVSSYEQALVWLGAAEGMDDSFLITMFSVKVCSGFLVLARPTNSCCFHKVSMCRV